MLREVLRAKTPRSISPDAASNHSGRSSYKSFSKLKSSSYRSPTPPFKFMKPTASPITPIVKSSEAGQVESAERELVDDASDDASVAPAQIRNHRLQADAYQHFQTTGQSFGSGTKAAAPKQPVWNNLYSKTGPDLRSIF